VEEIRFHDVNPLSIWPQLSAVQESLQAAFGEIG
jgi:hypothetical protein